MNNENKSKINLNGIILSKIENIFVLELNKYKCENEMLDYCAQALKNNFKLIEVFNNNTLSDCELLSFLKKVRQLCSIFNSYLIIHNRIDIAQLSNSDGVILDFKGLLYSDVIKLLHDDKIIAYKLSNSSNLNEILKYNYDYIRFEFEYNSKEHLNLNSKIFFSQNVYNTIN